MSIFYDMRSGFLGLSNNIARFNPRSYQIQVGRSIIAVGEFATLSLTTWPNLTTEVAGRDAASYCSSIRRASLFCIGSDTPNVVGLWVGLVIAAMVVAGVYPRFVAPLHVWLAISMNASLSLPDGGEAVAAFATILLIPILIADNRACAWLRSSAPVNPYLGAISYAASIALCLQIAGIYLESGLAKLAVSDWVSGTAMYYVIRDPYFGASGLLGSLMNWVTQIPLGSAVLTWGTCILECAIGVFFLSKSRYKRYALVGVIVLHLGIAVTIGLWSFSLTMIGTAMVAAYTLSTRLVTVEEERLLDQTGRAVPLEFDESSDLKQPSFSI
ncbi:hypothetical protein E3O44_09105 [Cryobacterium algoricola]|uniref:HTTM-like domain-containing protein n=1 Tax=Cryobacterium algoricola TaxID=1259183 RepID=A0ABY2IF20_9MICO|nr:sporulation-delaying protein SdpB family protein [Cryobacterium algoricola]TFB87272.1 hypothetical protein E3O44_09105 [Cryobacterium algoricola]